MREDRDSMLLVRADLCDRLESLQRLSARITAQEFNRNVDRLRLAAAAYGLTPVVRLAEALERAVTETGLRQARGCPVSLYLDRLGDAIGCERVDEQASQAMLASVSVRLSA